MSNVQQAIELIRQRGAMRSPEIEKELDITSAAATLQHKVDDGTLIMCKVERPGLRPCNEYRLSAKAGGQAPGIAPVGRSPREPDPVRERLAEWKPAPKPKNGHDALARGDDLERRTPAEAQGDEASRASERMAAALMRAEARNADRAHAGSVPASIGKIEKHVPLPADKGALRQALKVMEAGQSRLITGYTKHNIHSSASREQVMVRIAKEGAGFRVWRIT